MGTKMSKARNAVTGELLTLQQCEDLSPLPPFICATERCGADVRRVPRHERQLDTKTVIVEAYFGLKGGETHAKTCRYNTAGQVCIIARGSDPDVLRSIDQGKHEFRLHILHEALRDALAEGPQEPDRALPSNRRNTIRVDRQGRPISIRGSPICSTARPAKRIAWPDRPR